MAEREEQVSAKTALARLQFNIDLDASQPYGVIDDVVHTWDQRPVTQQQKCDDAQALVDRLEEEVKIINNGFFIGNLIDQDCEARISRCIDQSNNYWANLGIYSPDDWDTSGYCRINSFWDSSFLQTSY